MAESIKTRVNRGIRKLDKDWPGWANKVKPANLQMSSNFECVLGQLGGVGGAYTAQEKLGLKNDQVDTHGFEVDYDNEEEQTTLWTEAIKARRAEARASKKSAKKTTSKKRTSKK